VLAFVLALAALRCFRTDFRACVFAGFGVSVLVVAVVLLPVLGAVCAIPDRDKVPSNASSIAIFFISLNS
jgi:hypothetical protein